MTGIIAIFVFTFAISALGTPFFRRVLFKAGIIDVPSASKAHSRPTPRGAGMVMLISFILGTLVASRFFLSLGPSDIKVVFYFLSAATLIAVWGFVDDAMDLSPALKVAGQILASLLIIAAGIRIGLLPVILSVPLSIFWLVGITNAYNLIDGMDGLAAGTAFVSSIVIAFLFYLNGAQLPFYLCLALAGSILGFLPYNLHPAAVFMGDCGSMFIGLVLGALGIMFTSQVGNYLYLFIPVIILFVPVVDTFLSIVRRLYRKKHVLDSDLGHFYDHLRSSRKMTTGSIVSLTCFATLCSGLFAVVVYLFS